MKTIGKTKLEKLRIGRGISLESLSKMTGVAKKDLESIENFTLNFNENFKKKIADALYLRLEQLDDNIVVLHDGYKSIILVNKEENANV